MNLESKTEFASSHTLNRDLWSNDTVTEAVMSSFVLWHIYDNTIEGKMMSNLYEIESAPPVVLVIDPVTGQKMGMWSGVIEAQRFVEDLSWFSEAGPHEDIESLISETEEEYQTCSEGEEFEKEDDWSSSSNNFEGPFWGEEWSPSNNDDDIVDPSWGEEFENEETWSPSNNDDDDMVDPPLKPGQYLVDLPDLTEEPKVDCDKSLVCTLCVRVPDGRRRQRRFLKTEPFQLLWSFCNSLLEEWEIEFNAYKPVLEIPGDSKTLHCPLDTTNTTFEESGLANNSLISILLK